MKNKKILLGIVLGFVLLMAGAYILYEQLGDGMSPGQMVLYEASQPTAQAENTAAATELATEAVTEIPPETTAEPEVAPTETAVVPEETAPKGIPAPDFTVYDSAGNAVHLSDFFGKPIVLNFWASWCGPCKSEMPDFNEKYAEYGNEVHFLMVNVTGGRETQQSAEAFIEQSGYDFPVYFDLQGNASMTYGAYSIPMSFFINAQGRLITHAVGAISGELLQIGIDMIME